MWLAYSADPRMRINVGIRRRLAPLVDNNRRRIELLNSILFSFPGTPILYYGDEIGMGDNIYLGDRNGVRTPMQWNSDRNAGFSRAVPAALYSPVIMDPIWGYQAINVEAQESDTSSLLHWTRNMIALRKLFQVFGRGTLEFLKPENRKVLAYLREWEGERVVCVANLSRFAQPVTLDLSRFEGSVPVEMLGYVPFPKIGSSPYAVTLGPYSFLWLELQTPEIAEAEAAPAELISKEIVIPAHDIEGVLGSVGAQLLQESFLPKYLCGQRWFGAKSRHIQNVMIQDAWHLASTDAALLLLEVQYTDGGEADHYTLPLAVRPENEDVSYAPDAVIARLLDAKFQGVLLDGLVLPEVRESLLGAIAEGTTEGTEQGGKAEGKASTSFSEIRGKEALLSRKGSAEQSNSSLLFGDRLILKLFRRLQPGENPDAEIGRFLTEVAHFPHIAPYAGELVYTGAAPGAEATTIGLLQGLVTNQGDGWYWTLDEIKAQMAAPEDGSLRDRYLAGARLLGQRTGEMHGALATSTEDAAFQSEATTTEALTADAGRLSGQIAAALQAVKSRMTTLPEELLTPAATLIARREDLRSMANRLRALPPEHAGRRTRIHGDYHLGQVLKTAGDFVLLDFEGEPARSLAERRAKQSPLRDVAGMLRSFSYAGVAGFSSDPSQTEIRRAWENAASGAFLEGYRAASTQDVGGEATQELMRAYLLEKSLYELMYELNNRPDWVAIPLFGILELLETGRK